MTPIVAYRVTVPAADEDEATAALWESGTEGVEVRPVEGGVMLLAYFRDRAGLPQALAAALAPLPSAHVQATEVAEVDWVERFRESFRALAVGRFVIAPPWDVPSLPDPDTRLILVDPGRAFGTGTHETTRLCLLALEDMASRGPLGRVVDLGTGTGILAVAARILGGETVTGVDVDPEAIESARLHARLNRADVRLLLGDGGRPFAPGRFDLVLANITTPLLRDRRDEIAALRAPGAALVLAGLLTEDVASLRDAYAPLGALDVRTLGEWAAVLVRSEARP